MYRDHLRDGKLYVSGIVFAVRLVIWALRVRECVPHNTHVVIRKHPCGWKIAGIVCISHSRSFEMHDRYFMHMQHAGLFALFNG